MSLLIISSNYNDILSLFGVTSSHEAASTARTPIPSESDPDPFNTVHKKERELPQTTTKQMHQKQQPKKHQSRPTSPQSSDLYKNMEAQISQLKATYESSIGTPSEITSALRYADYLKQRDATIHDGGTYQMEAISVYLRAIDLLETRWRLEMLNGENTRSTRLEKEAASGTIMHDDMDYEEEDHTQDGLHRELFLDIEYKSTEGLLCAAYTNLGKVYFMSNMFGRAVSSYEQCLSYDASYLDALTYRAQANVILGRYKDAGRDYVRVMKLDTDRIFVDSFTGLAQVLSAKEDAVEGGWETLIQVLRAELPRYTEAYEGSKAANNQIGMKHFADTLKRMHHSMFKYHDGKTKDASEAWAHIQKGNEYKMSTVAPFNKKFEQQRVQAVKQVFVKGFFPQGIGSPTRTPIFIIGFVRSGSTLLERILDAHPLIVGTGEDSVFNGRLDFIRNKIVTASQAGDLSILHDTVTKLADDVVSDMIQRWEIIDANSREVSEDGEPEKDEEKAKPIRFSDKMLTNYMNVGFIHLLFPNALILHVAREPMDTIFSAFKHDFPSGGLDYTSEFEGLAQLYHSYRDVMEHW
jgi:tetratricopeptide (TPR) repeat protein